MSTRRDFGRAAAGGAAARLAGLALAPGMFKQDAVVRRLQQRHKASARVALYPYCAIQHPEFDLDEPPRT